MKIDPHLQTSNEILPKVKDRSYEDIMSSTNAIPTPSHPVPKSPALDKSLDVPSTIRESGPSLTDSTEPLQDSLTAPSASQAGDVPPTTKTPTVPPSPRPQFSGADIISPRDDASSQHVQEGHAIDNPQPEIAAEPAPGANGNLNTPSSDPADEPCSSADGSTATAAVDDDRETLQENTEEIVDTDVTSEQPAVVAEETKRNDHAESDDKLQPEATVAEPAEESPVTATPAPGLDETTAHTSEITIHPQAPTEEMKPNEPENTETEKEAPENVTVAHEGPVVLEEVHTNGHVNAKGEHNGENPSDSGVPADTTPTPVPNETDALSSSQPEPAEKLDEAPTTTVPVVDKAEEESAGVPSQPTTGEQDLTSVLPSAETTEATPSQLAEPVIEAPEPPLSSDPARATVDEGSELVVPPHGQLEGKEQLETDATAAGALKEAFHAAVDVENSTPALQCTELAVGETEQALHSQQGEEITSTAPVPEAPTLPATGAQVPTSTEPAEDIPAQSAGLTSAAAEPPSNTEDPVEPPLPSTDPPEKASHLQDSHLEAVEVLVSTDEGHTADPPPEELGVNVQAGAKERTSEDISNEGTGDLAQPVSIVDLAQEEAKQRETAELTKEGTDRSTCFVPRNR
jgi:hypothetical protein